MVFSPDESTSFLDNSSMLSYQDLGDDMIGSSMPSIGSIKDSAELDELFRQVGLSGYTIIDDDMDGLNDDN